MALLDWYKRLLTGALLTNRTLGGADHPPNG
jgi:hypothetical protein